MGRTRKDKQVDPFEKYDQLWSWEYRIFHQGNNYFIGEAFYEKGGKFNGNFSATDYNPLQAENVEELAKEHSHIMEAFTKPVIELPEEEKDKK
jgi:hypothetical protein